MLVDRLVLRGIGMDNPYCVLTLEKQKFFTTVKWGTINPTFNETFVLYCFLPSSVPVHAHEPASMFVTASALLLIEFAAAPFTTSRPY